MAENLWNIPGVPHRGWVCTACFDTGEPAHTCEMCGQEGVRYVHDMAHPDYPFEYKVGCVCAEKMATGYDAKASEGAVKNLVARQKRWLDKWKVSKCGNLYTKSGGLVFIIGQRHDGQWWAKYGDDFMPRFFKSEKHAKHALFDCFDGCVPTP